MRSTEGQKHQLSCSCAKRGRALTTPIRVLSRGQPQVSLQLAQDDERVVVSLDDVIDLFEPDSNFLLAADAVAARVVHGHSRILVGPVEERERLALVHVLGDVEHDDIVKHFHLERDPLAPLGARPPEDEFDLHVLPRAARDGVDRFRVLGVRQPNRVASIDRGVD